MGFKPTQIYPTQIYAPDSDHIITRISHRFRQTSLPAPPAAGDGTRIHTAFSSLLSTELR
jgi:hypothetical protein